MNQSESDSLSLHTSRRVIQPIRIFFLRTVVNQQADPMDAELLILKVKENRAIYDARDKNHSNRNFIASAWRKIGRELGVSGDQLKEKWHQLRSNYMRVKRCGKNKSSRSRAKTKTKWPYYDMMSFLDPFSDSKNTSGIVKQESPQRPTSLSRELENKTGTNENLPTKTSTAKAGRPKATKRKREAAVVDDVDFQCSSKLRKTDSSRSDEKDPDKMFLLSLLPLLKDLTPADNMDFKLYALQFLRDKLYPTSMGYSFCSEPQSPQFYENQQQYHEWSESDLTSPGSPTSSLVHFNEISSPPEPN